MKTIKIPIHLDEEAQIKWLQNAFTQIVKKCKEKKVKDLIIGVNYGGNPIIINGEETPCVKEWTLKEMKQWLKDLIKWPRKAAN